MEVRPPPPPRLLRTVPQADIDKAMDTETTLTFWTWVPDITNEVKLFTTKYPKIKVNVVNVGQGAPHYQKLRTAIQSGQGAPDVAQVEFQFINSFTLGDGSLLDLTPYAPAALKDNYPDWVWSQVNTNGGLWGIPQDTGPMGLLYREDLLSAAGIERAEDLRRIRCSSSDVPLQESQELPGERRPEPARPDCRLPVAGRCSAVHLRRQANGQGGLGQPRGTRRLPSSGATW